MEITIGYYKNDNTLFIIIARQDSEYPAWSHGTFYPNPTLSSLKRAIQLGLTIGPPAINNFESSVQVVFSSIKG